MSAGSVEVQSSRSEKRIKLARPSNPRNSFSPFIDKVLPGPASKQVKRGHRGPPSPMIGALSFESHPLWLWALRPVDWEVLFVTCQDAERLRTNFLSTWERWKGILIPKSEVNGMPIRGNDDIKVWWISGSSAFCDGHLGNSSDCPRAVCQVGGRRTPPSTESSEWYQIGHQHVGGSTNARGIFCLSHLPRLTIPQDLPRTLAHIVKHSVRGVPCSIPLQEAHYSVSDRLLLGKIGQPLLLQSFYSRSGWAKRPLVPQELEMAFELPDYLPWDASFVSRVPPLQLLRAVMTSILSGICQGPGPETKRQKLSSLLSFEAAEDRSWLPDSWTDTTIADKAVKSDSAEIDRSPWNQRIMLVFPWISPRIIHIMERLCYIRWCRALSRRSFTNYMTTRHGVRWPEQLVHLRRLRGSEQTKGGDPTEIGSKRRRLTMEPLNKGGNKEEGNEEWEGKEGVDGTDGGIKEIDVPIEGHALDASEQLERENATQAETNQALS